MEELPIRRTATKGRVLSLVSVMFALAFMISFVLSSLELYRLQGWRGELEEEIAVLERENQSVLIEIERRESAEWIERAAADAGLLPSDSIVVRMEASQVAENELEPSQEPESVTTPMAVPASQGLFDNPNWRAWQQLILGG